MAVDRRHPPSSVLHPRFSPSQPQEDLPLVEEAGEEQNEEEGDGGGAHSECGADEGKWWGRTRVGLKSKKERLLLKRAQARPFNLFLLLPKLSRADNHFGPVDPLQYRSDDPPV